MSLVEGMLSRLSRGFSGCAAGGAVLLAAGRLRAQDLGPTLLSYNAVEGCPEVAEFQRSVQRRSAHIHFVDEGTHERELSVVLRKEGEYTTGELRLTEPGGGMRQRSVRFTTCAEAVEGLALITAVSLDPQALLEPASPTPSAAPPTSSAPPPKPPPPKPPPRGAPAESAQAFAARGARLDTGVGVAFSAAFRALPASALGGALFFDAGSASDSWLAPLFRISLNHVERRGLAEANSKANFTLTLVTLAGCPVRLGVGLLVLRPCAFGSGGALHAWGTETSDPHARTRQYWSWGGSLFVFLELSQVFELVGDVALGTPLIQDRFVVGQTPFWQTPSLYLSNEVGLKFVFR